LALKDIDGNLTIHLAATDKKYRATGVGVSLYANAAIVGKQHGYGWLHGRIHTLNIPVINLYASLGATFSNPLDVFLKEIK
jgi:GNAT superfamily N-acetyltransferase